MTTSLHDTPLISGGEVQILHFVVKNQVSFCPYGKAHFISSVATHIPDILKCHLLKTEGNCQ